MSGVVSKAASQRHDLIDLADKKRNHSVPKSEIQNKEIRLLLAGSGAGAITKTVVAPLERLKILFQIQGMQGEARKYNGVFPALRTVVTEEGIWSLWKGNGANVIRVMPVYGLKFGFNDKFKDMFRGESNRKLGRMEQMAAGTTAGLFTTCCTYPLDTIRTRLSLAAGLGVRYNGIWDCGIQTVRKEGWTALFKGISMTFLSGAPYVGLQMTFYEVFKDHYPKQEDGESSVFWKVVAGASAGIIAQTVTYPGDVIRRRMQTNGLSGTERLYTNTWDCCKKVGRLEGWKAFFKGYHVNLVRSIPGAGIQFVAYEFCKTTLGL